MDYSLQDQWKVKLECFGTSVNSFGFHIALLLQALFLKTTQWSEKLKMSIDKLIKWKSELYLQEILMKEKLSVSLPAPSRMPNAVTLCHF